MKNEIPSETFCVGYDPVQAFSSPAISPQEANRTDRQTTSSHVHTIAIEHYTKDGIDFILAKSPEVLGPE